MPRRRGNSPDHDEFPSASSPDDPRERAELSDDAEIHFDPADFAADDDVSTTNAEQYVADEYIQDMPGDDISFNPEDFPPPDERPDVISLPPQHPLQGGGFDRAFVMSGAAPDHLSDDNFAEDNPLGDAFPGPQEYNAADEAWLQ